MRQAARAAALTFGALCVCLALALAALSVLGGASAETVVPPSAGPRAVDQPRPVSSPVESSSELAAPAESGQIGSGSVSGSSVLAESSGEQPSASASADTETSDTENPGGDSDARPSLGSAGTVASSPRPARPEVPEDKTMRLTIPAMARVEGAEVRNAAYDDRAALDAGALHPKGTGFPWERRANVYIAAHRIGYPGTGSFLLFRDLNTLTQGDSVFVTDAMGRTHRYAVSAKEVVGPDKRSVMDEREGSNILTLQTCTLPDYTQRLIVRAVKVEEY